MSHNLKKLDPLLRLMVQELAEDSERRLVDHHSLPGTDQTVSVLVSYEGPLDELRAAGLDVNLPDEHIVGGQIEVANLLKLVAVPGVKYVEYPHPDRLRLDGSIKEIKANGLRTVNASNGVWSGSAGQGVIVGIVDTGIDIKHSAFRNKGAARTTRILFLWDQSILKEGSEVIPKIAGNTMFGVEYNAQWINDALKDPPTKTVRQKDTDGHGSHVAGIAVGNGSGAERCSDAFEYVGVAPAADLIIVKLRSFGDEKASSRADDLVNAVKYIFEKATAANKAAVVNISLGSHWGSHDGKETNTSALNNLVVADPEGRAIVVSAGNEASIKNHVKATVTQGNELNVPFEIQSGDKESQWLDLWYEPPGKLQASVIAPDGTATDLTSDSVDELKQKTLPDGTQVSVNADFSHPTNSSHRISVNITPKKDEKLPSGEWKLRLKNTGANDVEFHAWLSEDDDHQPVFKNAGQISKETTLVTYACAERIIAVANYKDDGSTSGKLAKSSSWGQTRDGRMKPDIAAPGTNITAPRGVDGKVKNETFCSCCRDLYTEKDGTSMAAPHVAGAIALAFQKNKTLKTSQIITHLHDSTVRDDNTKKNPDTDSAVTIPNLFWGWGKLNVTELLNKFSALAPSPSVSPAPSPSPTPAPAPAPASPRRRPISWQALEQRLRATPAGEFWYDLIEKHFMEVYQLVNTNKRVATIWHRNHGPRLLTQAMLAASSPDQPLPIEFEGQSIQERLDKLLNIIVRYASDTLAADIAQYRDLLWAFEGLSLNQIFEQLDVKESV